MIVQDSTFHPWQLQREQSKGRGIFFFFPETEGCEVPYEKCVNDSIHFSFLCKKKVTPTRSGCDGQDSHHRGLYLTDSAPVVRGCYMARLTSHREAVQGPNLITGTRSQQSVLSAWCQKRKSEI